MISRDALNRIVDITSLTVISAAAALTAACSYQSGRWSGAQARHYDLANANRAAAAMSSNRAIADTAIDVNMFMQYSIAEEQGDRRRESFLFERFRPEMQKAVAAWIKTDPLHNARAPKSPLNMAQYSSKDTQLAAQDERDANENFRAAQVANRHADDFLLLTVIFASASFLAGISTKMLFPRHLVIVAISLIALIYGLARMIGLPFL